MLYGVLVTSQHQSGKRVTSSEQETSDSDWWLCWWSFAVQFFGFCVRIPSGMALDPFMWKYSGHTELSEQIGRLQPALFLCVNTNKNCNSLIVLPPVKARLSRLRSNQQLCSDHLLIYCKLVPRGPFDYDISRQRFKDMGKLEFIRNTPLYWLLAQE